jgi:hypothetical protein
MAPIRRGAIDVDGDEPRAGLRQAVRDALTDAGSSAGDQRQAAVEQLVHGSPPVQRRCCDDRIYITIR